MDTYVHGQYKAICDRCGFEYQNVEIRKEWTGLMVCHGAGTNGCWEPRHPQDAVQGKADRQNPPWVRPEPPDEFRTKYEWNGSAWVEAE